MTRPEAIQTTTAPIEAAVAKAVAKEMTPSQPVSALELISRIFINQLHDLGVVLNNHQKEAALEALRKMGAHEGQSDKHKSIGTKKSGFTIGGLAGRAATLGFIAVRGGDMKSADALGNMIQSGLSATGELLANSDSAAVQGTGLAKVEGARDQQQRADAALRHSLETITSTSQVAMQALRAAAAA